MKNKIKNYLSCQYMCIERKNKKLNKSGFTLIELMISMAMIAILSAAALQIARFSDTQKNLTLATDEMKAAIRMAQSYSLSIPNTESDQHVCGFGVRTENNGKDYFVFYTYADNNAFKNNTNVCDTVAYKSWSVANGRELESFSFSSESGVTISTDKEVFFESPYGDPVSSARFTISGGNESRDIDVKSSGQVN